MVFADAGVEEDTARLVIAKNRRTDEVCDPI